MLLIELLCLSLTNNNELDLYMLAVSPDHQRHGIGSLLLKEGLAIADKANARTYLEASSAGVGLYQRHGWKVIDKLQIDLAAFGGSGKHSETFMIREADR